MLASRRLLLMRTHPQDEAMRTYREAIDGEMRRRNAARARAEHAPRWDDRPMRLAFFGALALMLAVNALLNVFPG
ncbi:MULTISPECIES: hypothetical protein [unclassified Bosea (in: a-proteobacteria)]|uniref:hypothetical protein n=1 Tax=unclassified Bosea (in: a-proteobacteria) TaxID=2653178 RepID=UPI00097102D7|nr:MULTISPECIES: hypothetical protein [unclassified Bosea (in: a-proteobacteria)]TAJ30414.1 MAG: hypothetical protein EPO59_11825 [Bosea sp. (in: a-proteobacteria)]